MWTQFHRLTRNLLPKARAWWMRINSVFDRIMQGLSDSENTAKAQADSLLSATLPDNDNFTATDAQNWERALAIPASEDATLDERKQAILDRINFPGGLLYRQTAAYLQSRLQAAGFDLYVHENNEALQSSLYGTFDYGGALYGTIAPEGQKIANYIDVESDSGFVFSSGDYLISTFFIGAEIFPNLADVQAYRLNELRELILKIKPAHSAAKLLINLI